jgi:hypothetical protein
VLPTVFAQLLRASQVAEKTVRYGACMVLADCLEALPERLVLGEQLGRALLKGLCLRARDRDAGVREAAIRGMLRFQEPEQAGCPVVSTLLQMIHSDKSPQVRKRALESIAVSKRTLGQILARTRDTRPELRLTAFQILEKKVALTMLTREQRTALCSVGLKDRERAIRHACFQMLEKNWLESCQGDLLRLLELLTPTAEETGELVLRALMRRQYFPEALTFIDRYLDEAARESAACEPGASLGDDLPTSLAIEQDPQSPDRAAAAAESWPVGELLLWRVTLEEAVAGHWPEEKIEQLLPATPDFTALLRSRQLRTSALIAKQLLMITHFVMRASDIYGRGMLSSELANCVQDIDFPEEVVALCLKRLHEIHPVENEFIRCIWESVVELRDPIEVFNSEEATEAIKEQVEEFNILVDDLELKQSQLQTLPPGSKARHRLEAAVAALQSQVEERVAEEDARVHFFNLIEIRSLTLLRELALLVPACVLRTDMLMGLFATAVGQALAAADSPALLQAGIGCATVFGLLSSDISGHRMSAFVKWASEQEVDPEIWSAADQELVQNASLQAIFDLLCAHGVAPFLSNANSPLASLDDFIPFLVKKMRAENATLRTTAIEGFAKLVALGRIRSGRFVTPLLIQFFNPKTEQDTRVRQCLSVFFQFYVTLGSVQKYQLIDAFKEATVVVKSARPTSTMSTIDVPAMVKVLAALTSLADNDEIVGGRTPHAALLAEVLALLEHQSRNIDTAALVGTLSRFEQLMPMETAVRHDLVIHIEAAMHAAGPKHRPALSRILDLVQGAKEHQQRPRKKPSS